MNIDLGLLAALAPATSILVYGLRAGANALLPMVNLGSATAFSVAALTLTASLLNLLAAMIQGDLSHVNWELMSAQIVATITTASAFFSLAKSAWKDAKNFS